MKHMGPSFMLIKYQLQRKTQSSCYSSLSLHQNIYFKIQLIKVVGFTPELDVFKIA